MVGCMIGIFSASGRYSQRASVGPSAMPPRRLVQRERGGKTESILMIAPPLQLISNARWLNTPIWTKPTAFGMPIAGIGMSMSMATLCAMNTDKRFASSAVL